MGAVALDLTRVPEAPLTDIQPLRLPAADHVFRVEGRIPWLDVQVSHYHIRDIRFLRSGGRTVRREYVQG